MIRVTVEIDVKDEFASLGAAETYIGEELDPLFEDLLPVTRWNVVKLEEVES